MNINHFLLAATRLTSEEIFPPRSGLSDWGTFVVIAASCLVGLAAVLGVMFYYTRRRTQHPHHHHRHRPHHSESDDTSSNKTSPGEEPQSASGERLRRRRRRRNHRPRNPTLAETGGLPPVRKDPPPGP
jgi:hypothetical protein